MMTALGLAKSSAQPTLLLNSRTPSTPEVHRQNRRGIRRANRASDSTGDKHATESAGLGIERTG